MTVGDWEEAKKIKMKRYVFEFTGTVTPKKGDPFTERFFVIATCEVEGAIILTRSNPKVPDLSYTGRWYLCNKDWDV